MSARERLEAVSALRRARLQRNWTLEDAVGQIDRCSPGHGSGATPSLLSSWERGKVRTSPRYRRVLCELYGLSPEVLFAHQDQEPDTEAGGALHPGAVLGLLSTHPDLVAAMVEVVRNARSFLVMTGSRSRDRGYLQTVEDAVRTNPGLVCYRVLFGPPRHQVMHDHLRRLLEIRSPDDRSLGVKTMHIGLVDPLLMPERFFVASETGAVVVIASLTSAEAFDTGVLLDADAAAGLAGHARELYAGAQRVESVETIRLLPRPAGSGRC